MEMNSSSVRSGIWWGEATDEPAREDARPTEHAAPLAAPKWNEGGPGLACHAEVGRRRGNGMARVATKISLRTELRKQVRYLNCSKKE